MQLIDWNKQRILTLAVATTAALLLPLLARAAGLKSGDAFPDLAAYNLEGKLPEGLKGKVVMVDFWASWCGPCKQSFPAMNELQQKFGAQGLVIIAVNVDESKSDMDAFLRDHPASFTVMRDAAQKLVDKVSIKTMPSSFILDREGKVVSAHSGFDGDGTKKQYETEISALLK
jgi:thiol-disulfide isomerase/thioredoxin